MVFGGGERAQFIYTGQWGPGKTNCITQFGDFGLERRTLRKAGILVTVTGQFHPLSLEHSSNSSSQQGIRRKRTRRHSMPESMLADTTILNISKVHQNAH